MLQFIFIVYFAFILNFALQAINIYTLFIDSKKTICFIYQQISAYKDCQPLISYKYSMMISKDTYSEYNDYYHFIFKLDQPPSNLKYLTNYQYIEETFPIRPPVKKVFLLPQIQRYCVIHHESCHRKLFEDNYPKRKFSYLVYGDDNIFWQWLNTQQYQCKFNLALNTDIIKKMALPYEIDNQFKKTQYFVCYSQHNKMVRISRKEIKRILR